MCAVGCINALSCFLMWTTYTVHAARPAQDDEITRSTYLSGVAGTWMNAWMKISPGVELSGIQITSSNVSAILLIRMRLYMLVRRYIITVVFYCCCCCCWRCGAAWGVSVCYWVNEWVRFHKLETQVIFDLHHIRNNIVSVCMCLPLKYHILIYVWMS